MPDDKIVLYRGCKIFTGPDHRGRRQLWVSIPGHIGAQRFACHTIEDGKAAIDAHLDNQSDGDQRSIGSIIGTIFAGLIIVALLLAMASMKQG